MRTRMLEERGGQQGGDGLGKKKSYARLLSRPGTLDAAGADAHRDLLRSQLPAAQPGAAVELTAVQPKPNLTCHRFGDEPRACSKSYLRGPLAIAHTHTHTHFTSTPVAITWRCTVGTLHAYRMPCPSAPAEAASTSAHGSAVLIRITLPISAVLASQ